MLDLDAEAGSLLLILTGIVVDAGVRSALEGVGGSASKAACSTGISSAGVVGGSGMGWTLSENEMKC